MFATAVPAWTCAHHGEQINLGEQIKVIPLANRAGFHEILSGVACEPSAHEHIQDIMDVFFGL
jgi:hypothetical protein